MRAMVPERFLKSKVATTTDARRAFSLEWRDGLRVAGLIAAITATLALVCWITGLDNRVAEAIYRPGAAWGWALRAWGAWLGGASALLALPLCLWAPLGKRAPLVQQSALIVLLTAVLGAGLVNQVMVKDLADRPRPRDALLSAMVPANSRIQPATVAEGEGLHGKSMPSGHAGMAGVLVAPFFVLRRRQPELAVAFLLIGGVAGFGVGAARMVLGAHFLSDVLVAMGINLALAAALAPVIRWQVGRQSWWTSGILAGCTLLGVLVMVLGNRFDLTLSTPLPGGIAQLPGFDLPCWREQQVRAGMDGGLKTPEIRVELKGFGAPLSALKLVIEPGSQRLGLESHHGLYRGLKCTVTLVGTGK